MHFEIVDFIADIAQNAVEAGASLVGLEIGEDEESVHVRVSDNGCGMDEEEKARAMDPFRSGGAKHPGRKVGLGLPFLAQAIEQNGGEFSLRSEKGRGSLVEFRFDRRQVDCPPMGDLPGLFLSTLCLSGEHEMTIRRTRQGGAGKAGLDYQLSRSELTEALGGLERASSLSLLKEYLESQENG
jgi:anti-sigma regulatory factor (Ser/Thr protein kinase)